MLIIAMIQFSLAAFCQVTQVDSAFIITKNYAQFIALKFDSLDAYKIAHNKAVNAADTCNSLLKYSETIIKEQDIQFKLQLRQISAQNEIIESYKRSEFVFTDIQKQLKKETRKRKSWKVAAVSFISLFSLSLIYMAI
jgi:hypothetical protein